jgi:hypothetical protein
MKKEGAIMRSTVVVGLIVVVLIIFLLFSRRSLPEGTRVIINGKGYYNPLCLSSFKHESWSGSQRRQYCQATLVEGAEGIIRAGGDYETHCVGRGELPGFSYRVVFTTTLGNQRTLWFSDDSLEEIID